jgi:hypothetical protein
MSEAGLGDPELTRKQWCCACHRLAFSVHTLASLYVGHHLCLFDHLLLTVRCEAMRNVSIHFLAVGRPRRRHVAGALNARGQGGLMLWDVSSPFMVSEACEDPQASRSRTCIPRCKARYDG